MVRPGKLFGSYMLEFDHVGYRALCVCVCVCVRVDRMKGTS